MGNILGSGSLRRRIEEDEKKRQQIVREIHSRMATDEAAEERRNNILSLSLLELRDALQNDLVTATDALDAYMWKALLVQEKLNCVTRFLIEAFDNAKQLDDEWRGKKGKPTLFGIPFSVKDNFYMKGYDCTMGLAKFLFQPKETECTLVTHLRSQGAVPFAITNVPQALSSLICSNSVYGTTGNPYDPKRTPGSSSGGDAALYAAGGSAFGTGSDLAGSLRIPAAMCGIITLRPTEARLCVDNVIGGLPGKGRLGLSFGFYTKSVDEQIFLLRNILDSDEYHRLVPRTAPIPLDSKRLAEMQNKKLRIGYFVDDGFMQPVPACSRVVIETVEKLKEAGHELFVFRVPDVNGAASLFFKNIMPDDGEYIRSLYANDIIAPHLKQFVMLLKVPNFIRSFLGWLIRPFSPQLSIISRSYVRNLSDLRYTQQLTDEYTQTFTNMWKELELDALLCPAFTVPPVPHEYVSQLSTCAFTTGFINMLDFPAGVVPTGKVTVTDDSMLADENLWPTGKNIALKMMRRAARDSVGMPLAVQIVTLPFHEEECLAVMKIVEDLWKQ